LRDFGDRSSRGRDDLAGPCAWGSLRAALGLKQAARIRLFMQRHPSLSNVGAMPSVRVRARAEAVDYFFPDTGPKEKSICKV